MKRMFHVIFLDYFSSLIARASYTFGGQPISYDNASYISAVNCYSIYFRHFV